ncbi:MAG: carbon starvation protein A, partial [Oscillospiraceae bacterium]|nr:carbon starvation protein A [Oscillospiraceae bacterium]
KETDAKPIAYGGMLLECVLAVLTLCAVAYAYSWNAANPDNALKGATAIFGGGIAGMIDPSRGTVYDILYTLLVLTYSAF